MESSSSIELSVSNPMHLKSRCQITINHAPPTSKGNDLM
jgi:hypothetical protein